MRTGRFEPEQGPDGRQIYRLRWNAPGEHVSLTREERRRAEFIRYLIRLGRLSEGQDSSSSADLSSGRTETQK